MGSRWDEPIVNEPLEQDWPAESTVRVVPGIAEAVTGPLREDLGLTEKVGRSAAEWARLQILENAAGHIAEALSELEQAVSWFSVVDRADHSEMVRQVEGLADTIGYRLRNARE